MKKILILSDPNFEDEHAVFFRQDLQNGLVAAGYSVAVCLKRPFYFLKALSLARRADLIFTHNFPTLCKTANILSRLLKKKLFVKVVSDYSWESAIGRNKTPLLIGDFQKSRKDRKAAGLHKWQVRICQKAAKIIVPSDFLANIVTGWGIDREKIKIVNGSVDLRLPEISKEEARKKIGITGNLIVSAGALTPWRGFRMLVKIMPQFLQINQFFRLVIIGDGPEQKTLKSMIKNMGLDKKIYLIGDKKQEELGWYLSAADIFVLNTGYENFPYRLLEAMSAGVPVVTTAAGANTEIIKQGENGFLVRFNDEFNLVEAIKTVWQTPELRERFIEEGRKTAAHFSPEKMVEETIKQLVS